MVLDTDHFSEWERAGSAGIRLRAKLQATRPEMALTVITVEEQMRGWLAEINRHRDPHRQITSYSKLRRQIAALAEWIVLPWDADAADRFVQLRREGVRIGSLDLKIACIVLAHDATVLTRNSTDFAHVPGLRFENWLD